MVCKYFFLLSDVNAQCRLDQTSSFARWPGMTPDRGRPVFMYSASGNEESLTGACLTRCKDLEDCASVVVTYSKGSCQGLAKSPTSELRTDNDSAYFTKVCLKGSIFDYEETFFYISYLDKYRY